jgi:pimeloyl-ACP methyl ester carboxylesterase
MELNPTGGLLSYLPWSFSVGAIGLGSLAVLLYVFQDKLLYFPTMPPYSRTFFIPPEQFGLQQVLEEVFINTKDGHKIQAYFVPNMKRKGTAEVPTLLYFHGNAGNLSFRLPNVKRLVASVGVNVLIVSYRGYGKSEGTPSEEGLKIDAQAALDYLFYERDDIDKEKIVVFGRSLGGAVSIHLASENQDRVAAVVVENTFTSIPDMIDVVLRWLRPFKFLSRNRWSSKTTVSQLTMPILYLSGEKDELVPAWMMKELYERSTSSLRRHIIHFEEGTHMDTFMQPGYYKKVKKWLDSIFRKHPSQIEEEEEEEEVSNESHRLLTDEGDEAEALVEGSSL